MLTGKQVREACELLGWSRDDLQHQAVLPLYVIDQAIAAEHAIEATAASEILLRDAFQLAGIEFTPEGGVGLRKDND